MWLHWQNHNGVDHATGSEAQHRQDPQTPHNAAATDKNEEREAAPSLANRKSTKTIDAISSNNQSLLNT